MATDLNKSQHKKLLTEIDEALNANGITKEQTKGRRDERDNERLKRSIANIAKIAAANKQKDSTVVLAKSPLAHAIANAARSIDGIEDGYVENFERNSNLGNNEEIKTLVEDREEFSNKLQGIVKDFEALLDSQFEKRIGSRRDLNRFYERLVEQKKDDIVKSLRENSVPQVVQEFNIPGRLIGQVNDELQKIIAQERFMENIKGKKDSVVEALAGGMKPAQVSSEFGLKRPDVDRAISFFSKEIAQKKEELENSTKQAKQTAKKDTEENKETKAS